MINPFIYFDDWHVNNDDKSTSGQKWFEILLSEGLPWKVIELQSQSQPENPIISRQ